MRSYRTGETVAITRDIENSGVTRGQTGVVIGVESGVIQIEYAADDGRIHRVDAPADAVMGISSALRRAAVESESRTAIRQNWLRENPFLSVAIALVLMVPATVSVYYLVRQVDQGGPKPVHQGVQQIKIFPEVREFGHPRPGAMPPKPPPGVSQPQQTD